MQSFARQFGVLSILPRSLYPLRPRLLSTFITGTRRLHASAMMASPVKRKADQAATSTKPKKQRVTVPEYHITPQRRDDTGEVVWPARKAQIDRARDIITEW